MTELPEPEVRAVVGLDVGRARANEFTDQGVNEMGAVGVRFAVLASGQSLFDAKRGAQPAEKMAFILHPEGAQALAQALRQALDQLESEGPPPIP